MFVHSFRGVDLRKALELAVHSVAPSANHTPPATSSSATPTLPARCGSRWGARIAPARSQTCSTVYATAIHSIHRSGNSESRGLFCRIK